MSTQLTRKGEIDAVRATLERLRPQMALALPAHLTPDRLLRVTMTAVQNVPALLDCDRTSFFAAVMTSAQLGLEPDGVLGQAYLVPFKGKVQFIPGYKGYISLSRNSGEVKSLQAHEVCENDTFRYAYGLNEDLHHVPADGERGEITHFYAYAKFKDDGNIFEVMTRAQVDAVRDNSEAYKAFKAKKIKSTPWDTHYIQMGRKTLIRRIANYLPMSVQRAAAIEGAYDAGKAASADAFGDLVIEGESTDVTDETTTDTAKDAAKGKLDALAGTAKTEEEQTEVAEVTLAQVLKLVKRAKTEDDINEAIDLARPLSEADREKVRTAVLKKAETIGGGLFGDKT